MNNTPISDELGRQLLTAVQKLREIESQTILTKANEELKQSLTKFLGAALLDHADELVGCWTAIKAEYEPLLGGLAPVLRRLATIDLMNRRAAQPQTGERQPSATPGSDTLDKPTDGQPTTNSEQVPDNVIQFGRVACAD